MTPMDVRPAETEDEIEHVRRLFRSFLAWHRERHIDDLDLIDAYFDGPAYEREIAGLPGPYAPPEGALLLCWNAEIALGCGAFRRIDAQRCEMKRMFVAPTARGAGAGRALATALIERAKAAGYREMHLDTSVRQQEAITLYRDLGFVETPPTHEVPEAMQGWLLFFCREL
jgi:putative acetyltransferase